MTGGATVIGVLDLEWTAWEGSYKRGWSDPGEEMEIVQIGALRLRDDDGLTELDTLDILVTPTINPRLSDYFLALTGITQASLDRDGIAFADALAALAGFLGDGVETVYSFGDDYRVIMHNCRLNGFPFPFDAALFADAREIIVENVGKDAMAVTSSELPRIMGFSPPGQSHQAVDDCRCVAETLRILRQRGGF